jgi:hypothetical protein
VWQIQHDGQISEIVSSAFRKNIPLSISENQNYKHRRLIPRGGALAIVTKRWDGMRWTRAASGARFASDEALPAYGEVVWS